MSIWTHVAAVIRVDALRLAGFPKGRDLLTALAKDLPCGSEGPLEYTIRVNPEHHHLAAYVVTIFGDLRNYGSAQPVIDWLQEVTRGQMVRQGLAEISVEGHEPVRLRHVMEDDGTGHWERLPS